MTFFMGSTWRLICLGGHLHIAHWRLSKVYQTRADAFSKISQKFVKRYRETSVKFFQNLPKLFQNSFSFVKCFPKLLPFFQHPL